MVCSNEPGYYEDGAFGVRIENLFVIVEADTAFRWGGGGGGGGEGRIKDRVGVLEREERRDRKEVPTAPRPCRFGGSPFYTCDRLTMCPIQASALPPPPPPRALKLPGHVPLQAGARRPLRGPSLPGAHSPAAPPAPQKKMMVKEVMSAQEVAWVDGYHRQVSVG